jgi:hypothetical protein
VPSHRPPLPALKAAQTDWGKAEWPNTAPKKKNSRESARLTLINGGGGVFEKDFGSLKIHRGSASLMLLGYDTKAAISRELLCFGSLEGSFGYLPA